MQDDSLDAERYRALKRHAHDGLTVRAYGDGLMLWVHSPVSVSQPKQLDGADLDECVERMMREDARAKPFRAEMPTLPDNLAALRGKP